MKNNQKKPIFRRRFVTLIEIMIVMFLIALITGVVAYNYTGTLEEGKAFKTKAGIAKLESMLSLALADDPNADLSGGGWQEHIRNSKLVHNPEALMKDGWGKDYVVYFDKDTHAIHIHSDAYDNYQQKNKASLFKE